MELLAGRAFESEETTEERPKHGMRECILILDVSRGKDGEEVVKTPNSEFFLARDAVSATSHGGVLEHVEGDLAKQGEILGAVLPGDFASVLAKGNKVTSSTQCNLILDTPAEEIFENITQLAAHVLPTPIALRATSTFASIAACRCVRHRVTVSARSASSIGSREPSVPGKSRRSRCSLARWKWSSKSAARLGKVRDQPILLELPDAPVTVNADPDLFERLLENLVINAIDHGPAGQPISLTAVPSRSRPAATAATASGSSFRGHQDIPKHMPRYLKSRCEL